MLAARLRVAEVFQAACFAFRRVPGGYCCSLPPPEARASFRDQQRALIQKGFLIGQQK